MSQIQYLDPRFWSQVLENVLNVGPMSQVQVLGTGKCPGIRFYVLEKILDFGHQFQKMSQIQGLGLRKCPRFRTKSLEVVLELRLNSQKRPQIQALGPRFRSQVLENVVDLRPVSQDYVLGTGKVPRFRFYVVEKVLGLVSRCQKRSQIQVYYSYILSQVLVNLLDLGPRSWIYIIGSRKCPRLRS